MGMHPNVRMVSEALLAADAVDGAGEPSTVRLLPEAVKTAVAAANALGIEVGQIANSLIFVAGDAPLLVMTSGAHRVDTAIRAKPEFVLAHTGQAIGGVAPVGHPKPIRTLVDVALEPYGEIWAAGGIPESVFPTTYAELIRITAGTPSEVA
jgi:prolyl-tRNA editing enzyme YbaK/EbsC (Cys-tRNA(Pro) deacylase)